MNGPRYLYPVIALFVVLLLAWWIRERSPMARRQHASAAATATAVGPTAPVTAAPPTPHPPPGHRLAGLAVGAVSFVAVEHPDGSTALYRVGDDVPGLGRVEAITEAGATFTGDNGTMTLQVTAPAPPTATAIQLRTAPTEPPPGSTPTRPSPGRTEPESPPSVAPDQSAS